MTFKLPSNLLPTIVIIHVCISYDLNDVNGFVC